MVSAIEELLVSPEFFLDPGAAAAGIEDDAAEVEPLVSAMNDAGKLRSGTPQDLDGPDGMNAEGFVLETEDAAEFAGTRGQRDGSHGNTGIEVGLASGTGAVSQPKA